MAKLSAHDRMWIYAEKKDERRAYMSDGMVLVKHRDIHGKWGRWHVWGAWSSKRYGVICETKNRLLFEGWTLLLVPMERER